MHKIFNSRTTGPERTVRVETNPDGAYFEIKGYGCNVSPADAHEIAAFLTEHAPKPPRTYNGGFTEGDEVIVDFGDVKYFGRVDGGASTGAPPYVPVRITHAPAGSRFSGRGGGFRPEALTKVIA